jgi:hypothetical protein
VSTSLKVTVDFNGHHKNVAEFLPIGKGLDAVGNMLVIEDPIDTSDLAGYRELRRQLKTPAREDLLKRFRGLEITDCPFANLPEAKGGRWGHGLTAAKMEECLWIRPVLVGSSSSPSGRRTIT